MNAIQFIKEKGVDKAREVVEGAPDLAEYYSTIDGEYYRIELHAVNLRHLKRLVESVDLVNSLGGVQEATNKAFDMTMLVVGFNPDKIEQAIADYESIYGGENV